MARYDGTIRIFTNVDTSGVERGARNIETRMDSVKNKIGKIGGLIISVFAVRSLIKFGKSAVQLGSDLTEVQNVVDNVFKTMSKDVDDFAKNAASAFGLSETMAKRYTGTFGAMAKAFGFTEKEAYDMSTTLTGLAGDVASFYNIDQDAAYAKLKAVFSGETESLKDLGIVMTQTALDSYALQHGIGKTTAKMTEQEKVALRYRFILDQLSTASGDFARTSDGWANQVRILKLNFDSLKATIGQGLINVLTPVIKVINSILAKLATLANAFKSFTELITGKKSSGQTGGAAAGLSDVSGAASDAADSTGQLADATNDAADATAAAAKEQDKYLSGLDEMRKYMDDEVPSAGSPGKGGSGSGGGSGIGVGGGVSPVDYGELAKGDNELEKTNTLLDKLINKFRQLKELFSKGFWNGLGDYKGSFDKISVAVDSIKKSLTDIFTDPSVSASINGYIDSIAYTWGQRAGAFLSVGLSVATNLISGASQYLESSKDFIKGQLTRIFDAKTAFNQIVGDFSVAMADVLSVIQGENGTNITAQLMGIFSDGALGVTGILTQLGTDVTNLLLQPFIDNKDKFKRALDNFFAPISVKLTTLHASLQETVKKAQDVYDQKIGPLLQDVTDDISDLVGKILDWYNRDIAPVLAELSATFSEVWSDHIQPAINDALDLIGSLCGWIQMLWNNYIYPLLVWLVETFGPIIQLFLSTVGGYALGFLALIGDVTGGIMEFFGGLIEFLTGVFSGDWDKALAGLEKSARGLKYALGGIFNFIKDTILTGFDNFLTQVFEKDWSESFGAMGEVANAFLDVLKPIYDDLKKWLNDVIEFVKGVFKGDWELAWTSIKDIFGDIWNGLVDLAKAPMNLVIGALNALLDGVDWVINQINSKLSIDFTVKNPITGGTLFHLDWSPSIPNLPGRIPPLAQGAVIPPNAPFLAMLGDQTKGNNIEAPEDLIRKIVREESGGRDRNYTFIAQLNGRTLFSQMVTEAELRQMQTGRNPFELA